MASNLFVYNTLSAQKELFTPLDPEHVKIYVCGPTVYDYAHVGHARAYVAFDVIVRVLRSRFKRVTYVRNYTDVDDKILQRAAEQQLAPEQLSARFIEEFKQDMQALKVLSADVEPKVTEHLPEIIAFVARLLEKGYAYLTPSGDVYFASKKFSEYGKLSKRNFEQMLAGARVEVVAEKKDPMDFVLWKAAKPLEPAWNVPWGDIPGRPGWHIECSAMSAKYLGESFDIHGGGRDLIFPHHENEIAQSEAASAKPLATYWLHNGFVNIANEKMSKSLGNFLTVRDLLREYDSETIRYYLLTTHYRSLINFAEEHLKAAEERICYCYETLRQLTKRLDLNAPQVPTTPMQHPYLELLKDLQERFLTEMFDDFNTAKALGELSRLFNLANELLALKDLDATLLYVLQTLQNAISEVSKLLGIFGEAPEAVLERIANKRVHLKKIDKQEIEALIAARKAARAAKDFKQADNLRDKLLSLGVIIKDTAKGTEWFIS